MQNFEEWWQTYYQKHPVETAMSVPAIKEIARDAYAVNAWPKYFESADPETAIKFQVFDNASQVHGRYHLSSGRALANPGMTLAEITVSPYWKQISIEPPEITKRTGDGE